MDPIGPSLISSSFCLLLHLHDDWYLICICICILVCCICEFVSVLVLDSGSYRARSVCCDTRTIRLGAAPANPIPAPAHWEKLKSGFGTFGTGTVGAFGVWHIWQWSTLFGGQGCDSKPLLPGSQEKETNWDLLPGIHMIITLMIMEALLD